MRVMTSVLRWVWPGWGVSPEGTAETGLPLCLVSHPFGTYPLARLDPTLKRWAQSGAERFWLSARPRERTAGGTIDEEDGDRGGDRSS